MSQKVYMPVVVGDWLKGTRGMKAEVRGVYMGLLLHQWEKGFIPSDFSELEEIERDVRKVWDKLNHKFLEIEPGKLQNKHLEEIREFWAKQKKNGKTGGRPKKENPKPNPNSNPEENPKPNLHYALDIDIELLNKKECEEKISEALNEIYLDQERIKWQHVEFDFELEAFKNKVRGSPDHYRNHDTGGIRLAFQSQLRHAKRKTNNTSTAKASEINGRRASFSQRHGTGT